MPSRFLPPACAALAIMVGASGCTTTYDAYGRPVQSVDPGLAVAGMAAAGLAGYALGQNNGSTCVNTSVSYGFSTTPVFYRPYYPVYFPRRVVYAAPPCPPPVLYPPPVYGCPP